MSNSLWPHGLQHIRLPCPSTTPGTYSNLCPLSRWCHPTILSCVVPFSSCLQSLPVSGLFKWVSSSYQVARVLEFQLQHHSFQWIFRNDFLLDGLVGSPCYSRDSQESSPTPQFKCISSLTLSFLYSPTLTSMTTGKSITLMRQTFVGKIMSLFFNMLSRLVITFFPRSQFLVSGGQSIGVSASASVLPKNVQDWFPLGLTGWISLQWNYRTIIILLLLLE